jgi:hypothetical protein
MSDLKARPPKGARLKPAATWFAPRWLVNRFTADDLKIGLAFAPHLRL